MFPVSFIGSSIFNGATGVFIMFVIRNYLITSLLLREHEKGVSMEPRQLDPLDLDRIPCLSLFFIMRVAMRRCAGMTQTACFLTPQHGSRIIALNPLYRIVFPYLDR